MPSIPAFHSINEAAKPADQQVYHNNSVCRTAQTIPERERHEGTNNYRLCQMCDELSVLRR